MVGRKTSPRCDNCRKRKIKVVLISLYSVKTESMTLLQCDLSHPTCSQCTKRNLQCPGYDIDSRFFTYKKQHGEDSSATSSSGELSDSSGGGKASRRRDKLVVVRAPSLDAIESLRGDFVARLIQKTIAARFMVIPETQLLQHIPRRLGSNRALDNAVKCICSANSTSLDGSSKAGPIYSEALSSLQQALNDANQSLSSETLGAAILLQMFEHSVDHSEFRWVVHANGVINIILLRGPACIKNELDRSILQAQVGNIWFKALLDGTDCFLARPEWARVVADTFDGMEYANAEWSNMIRSGLPIPGIVRRYQELESREDSACETPDVQTPGAQDEAGCPTLLLDLWRARNELSELRTRFQLQTDKNNNSDASKPGSQPRSSHASKLAVNVFSILIEYMLETLLSTDAGARAAHCDLLDVVSLSGYAATAGRLNALASAARSELGALILADNIAATQTSMLSRMMIRKVLDAPLGRNSKLQYLSPIVEKLYDSLTEMNGNGDVTQQKWR